MTTFLKWSQAQRCKQGGQLGKKRHVCKQDVRHIAWDFFIAVLAFVVVFGMTAVLVYVDLV